MIYYSFRNVKIEVASANDIFFNLFGTCRPYVDSETPLMDKSLELFFGGGTARLPLA